MNQQLLQTQIFVSEEQFTGFSELFGELEGPYRLTMKKQNSIGYMDAEHVPLKDNRITFFHTDSASQQFYRALPLR
jgi:hypothetical protein